MGRNLSTLYISSSYQFLTQISGSELQDGLGNKITGSLDITASLATSASYAGTSGTSVSSSYSATASYANYAGTSGMASMATSASYALTASYAANATFNTSSLLITASAAANVITFTKGDASTFNITVDTGSAVTTNTGSLLVTASSANDTITYTKGDGTTFTNVINNVSASISASYATTATSASHAISANTATSASFASTIPNNLNITASNLLVTNNLTVNGTASFAYTKTTTGSAVIIGDSFVILNADTPTAVYAGIMVYDTGSASTASLEWNGITDTWITVEESGASAMILTGISGSKGSEAAPALNKLLKGQGNNTVADSTITDSGTLVTIDNNVSASGFISSSQFVGNLQGTASYASNALSSSYASNALSSSFALTASYALNVPSINTSSLATTGSNTFIGNETISGSLNVSGSVTGNVLGNNTDTFTSSAAVQQVVSLTQTEYNGITPDANTLYIISGSTPVNPSIYATTGSNTFVGNQIVSGSVTATTGFTGSLLGTASIAETAVTASYVLNAVSASYATNALSASIATTASYYDLSAVTQNAVFSGSVRGDVGALSISSNTASLDLSTGNFFTLTLVSGSNTYINPTNIQSGQTVNLRITQANPGNGTVSFPSSVKQVSGSIYTPTTGSGPVDIVTFISFDASSLYLSNVKNLV